MHSRNVGGNRDRRRAGDDGNRRRPCQAPSPSLWRYGTRVTVPLIVKPNPMKHPYDVSTIATLRQALDEIVADRRFAEHKFATALQVAEYLLSEAAAGERDLARLKDRAFDRLAKSAPRKPGSSAPN
jgi:hypothetical protein